MRRYQRDRFAHGDTVALKVSPCGRSQHDPGHIVPGKHQRAFDRALRQDHFTRADPPQFFARAIAKLGQVIGQPFDRANEVVMVITERRGPAQHRDVRRGGQVLEAFFQPRPQRRIGQRAAARLVLFVDQDHAFGGAAGFQRRVDPGGAGANNQQVAMRISGRVVIGIFLAWRFTKSGHAADHRLVQLVPERAGPHEGLVVKARREEHAEPVIDRAQICLERRPPVLAGRHQTVINFHPGGAQVGGVAARSAADRNQRVGFFAARAEQPARAVVLERAPEQHHAVGEQRRGERITGEPLIRRSVEAEADRAAAINPPAVIEPEPAHRRGSPAW